ncbi:class I SAM-dependent methyltransferase [Thalassovita taeanensis]|uniref:Methyltransferase domain-containing protein n=1 Tax=Thalassovita taeanensis TaxID=657014 RepID=A0A1H9GB14_9RHOB|nr:class I SAM-dependent methyltransferase [Thalassovita taeanensis]SEQ47203.1 Methyltransferase domain-containing protein [Thalassovita taeanensis]
MTDTVRITAANRTAWDTSAPHHGQGAYWDGLTAGFATPGYSRLDTLLSAALTDAGIAGSRVVQVGCNNGRELLSCFALGARQGLGIDQSGAFLAQAETLRDIAGADCNFLRADIYDLPQNAPSDFDVALITIGVLNWMPDLPGFFASVAGLLRPGGRLVIYETHPFLEMFNPDSETPLTPDFSYFRRDPFTETAALTYDGLQAEGAESHWFIHTVGAIVTACIGAGLRLDRLEEFPHSIREVEYALYQGQPAQLPLSYLLTATRA